MNSDTILTWLKAERLSLAGFLDDLDDHEWRMPSLCPGWTVRDVAAHLTLSTRTTIAGAFKGAVRARGDINRMIADQARERAARFGPVELIAQLRETAASSRRAPGTGPLDPLVDVLVHAQDIARPLGRERTMPAEPVIAALEHTRGNRFYGTHKRLRDARLVATDLDWSAGQGPKELRGPAADLLLVATGREAGLRGLSVTGVGPAEILP